MSKTVQKGSDACEMREASRCCRSGNRKPPCAEERTQAELSTIVAFASRPNVRLEHQRQRLEFKKTALNRSVEGSLTR